MMASSNQPPIKSSEITPEREYFNRRTFLKAGGLVASVAASAYLYRRFNGLPPPTVEEAPLADLTTPGIASPTTQSGATSQPGAAATSRPTEQLDPSIVKAFHVDEPKTPFQSITHYNNYYEFSTDKDGVAGAIGNFSTKGWKITVDGLCAKPATFDLDDFRRIAPPQERVYRMRCVEAWSMVIPWAGFSLYQLLNRVQPTSAAKYVAFTSVFDPTQLPGQKTDVLKWPYVEGLRMDEAMHPLTLMTTGLYGRVLPAQDGAPVRLITPWKYGFKGIKSIVKISLVEKEPPSTWNMVAPDEYGFYANVNPHHDHPRWSQATEQRIGESGRRPTLMFNGYGEQVAKLYAGMDLDKFY